MLDRVKKLIALTASSNENEARNAAYLACRLIREHGYDVVPKVTVAARAVFTSDGWDEAIRRAYESVYVKPEPGWRSIRSKYDAKCVACGCVVDQEEQVWWKQGYGVRCLMCGKPK